MKLTAADSINDARTQAHLDLVGRLGSIDLTPLLVYRIESAPAGALPFLGWQFDLLSPLWALVAPAAGSIDAAATPARRALIKTAIPLHQVRGTPYAIKKALESLGWPGVTILEGQDSWGGSSYSSSEGWAVFRVEVPLAGAPAWDATATYAAGSLVTLNGDFFLAGDGTAVGVPPQYSSIDEVEDVDAIIDWDNLLTTGWSMASAPAPSPVAAADVALIAEAVEFFKNARSWLDAVVFVGAVYDSAPSPTDYTGAVDRIAVPTDTVSSPATPVMDTVGPVSPTYAGRFYHSGITYGSNEPAVADLVTVNGEAIA